MLPVLILGHLNAEELQNRISECNLYESGKIYVFVDRYNGLENEKIEQNRKCIEVAIESKKATRIEKFVFSKSNLGQEFGIPFAIDWFFEFNDIGLILEDDCKLHPQAFVFLQESIKFLLRDSKIGAICLSNIWPQHKINHISSNTLISSPFFESWGWVTTKSKWNALYINEIEIDSAIECVNQISDLSFVQRKILTKIFDEQIALIKDGVMKTWALKFTLRILQSGGYCIFPPSNLVLHLANQDSVHVKKTPEWYRKVRLDSSYKVEKLTNIAKFSDLIRYTAKYMYGASIQRLIQAKMVRLKNSFEPNRAGKAKK